MYQINWKSLETGATGHGDPIFKTLVLANETADKLNKESPFMQHWVTISPVLDDNEHGNDPDGLCENRRKEQ